MDASPDASPNPSAAHRPGKVVGRSPAQRLHRLLSLGLLTVLALICQAAFGAEPIRLVTGEKYPPFTGRDLHSGGVLTALVTSAFARSGASTQVHFRPWARGYEDSLKLEYAATFPYIATDQREADFLFSDPLYLLKIRFYVKPDSPYQLGSPEELAQAVFCLPAGYEFAGWAAAQREQLNFVRPRTIEQCYEMMSRKRIDVLISNPANVAYLASVARPKQSALILRELQQPLADVSLHLMVPRQHPKAMALLNQFNRGLRHMQRSGELTRLFANHPDYQLVQPIPPPDLSQ